MAKDTIYDYDSSDNEEGYEGSIKYRDDNYKLYDIGNQFLNQKEITKEYHKKKQVKYKISEDSSDFIKVINSFLTKPLSHQNKEDRGSILLRLEPLINNTTEITDQIKTIEKTYALYKELERCQDDNKYTEINISVVKTNFDLLKTAKTNGLNKDTQRDISQIFNISFKDVPSFIEAIPITKKSTNTNSQADILKIQTEYQPDRINTTDLKFLKILKKDLSNLSQVEKQEISDIFAVPLLKVDNFLQQIQEIDDFNEDIDGIHTLITNNSKVINKNIEQYITNDSQSSYKSLALFMEPKIIDQIKTIEKSCELYKALELYQNDNKYDNIDASVVKTNFDLLKTAKTSGVDENTQRDISQIFNISFKDVPSFIEAIPITDKSTNTNAKANIKTRSNILKIQKEYQPDRINTTNLKFLEIIKGDLNHLNSERKQEISDIFAIPLSKVDNFLQQIQEIDDFNEDIDGIHTLITNNSKVINKNIEHYVGKQTVDLNLATQVLCNNQLGNLPKQLSIFNTEIKEQIKNLNFFCTTDNPVHTVNFFANSLIYQKYLKTLSKFNFLRELGEQNKFTSNYDIKINNQTTISTTSAVSIGLKRSELIQDLGNYDDISNKLDIAVKKLSLNNKNLIICLKDIIKGKSLYAEFQDNIDSVKTLYDIAYLLFSCEVNRNPSALITNAIFLELMERGEYSIKDISKKLPMALKDAIEIGRYFHTECKTHKRINDYGITKKPKNTDEFIAREKDLLSKWLNGRDCDLALTELINNWYPLNKDIELKSSKKSQNTTNFDKDDKGNEDHSKGKHGSNDSSKDNFRDGSGSDKSDHKFDKKASGGSDNKYCSVVLKKLVDYKENASGILDFKFTELEQPKCIEIDNAAKLKLEKILINKNPNSLKRSFYEAFPEELCYSGFSVKMLKLEANKAVECYYMKYCLGNTESEIINRLFWEGVLDREEWEDYTVLNQDRLLQHEPITSFTFDIDKQKESNVALLQKKFVAFELDDNKFDHVHNLNYYNHQHLEVTGDVIFLD